MLAELAERDARGDMVRIYREIRETAGVPYVSSLQRHLATRPGWLEWAWAAVRPVFITGIAPEAAAAAAANVKAAPLPALAVDALRLFGVDRDGARAIREVCDTVVRVAPANLMLSGLVKMMLEGARPSGREGEGASRAATWTPPEAPRNLPDLAGPDTVSAETWAVIRQLGTEVGSEPFVPGLYRMLGHWPAYIAHVATVLAPRFEDPATKQCCADVLASIDRAVVDVFRQLPPLGAEPAMPPADEFSAVLEALSRYRQTSPEMIVFGGLIRDALPDDDNKEMR